jgi:hypothetical protein
VKMAGYSEFTISSVLRQEAYTVTAGVNGRAVPDEVLGRLAELADIAALLDLEDDAARLSKLLAVARRGYVQDLTRAALVCLIEDRG